MNKLSFALCILTMFFASMLCGASAPVKSPNLLLLMGLIVIFIVIPTVFFAFFTKRK